MKYIKKFNNGDLLNSYKKSNFIAPHIYLENENESLHYFEEYDTLEYISSTQTGGQYINLGCQLLENTDDVEIDIKFNIIGNGQDNQGQSTFIAAQPEYSPYPGFVLRKDSENRVEFSAKWKFDNSIQNKNISGKWYSKYFSYDSGMGDYNFTKICGNIYETHLLVNNIPQSQVSNFNCHLFCALNGSNQPFRYCEADLYYLKFTKGGQVVRNLIPARRKKDNTIGLYDIENQYFYISQGNNPFVAGPKIS